jgi:Tfp pilus assembly PilM family ATPase
MSPSSARGASRSFRAGWLAPTPPTVAIEIASRRVTVVELASLRARPMVAGHASETLPAGAVTPALTGPNVADPPLVGEAVRRALERAGVAATRRAALIVPDSVARVSLIHFDQVPARPAELDQLIRWHLRKATPFPLDDTTVEHVLASANGGGATYAAIVARRDVLAQYEAVASAAGVHAGVVDLASFNVMNALMASDAAPAGDGPAASASPPAAPRADWLLVCLAHEGTSIAILRGHDLLFYRHRAAIDEEPLSALVHQTAMYHEDRLGGRSFARVWISGAALAGVDAERTRREIGERLGLAAETVDVRSSVELRDRIGAGAEVLDTLAAPVGVLVRERVV